MGKCSAISPHALHHVNYTVSELATTGKTKGAFIDIIYVHKVINSVVSDANMWTLDYSPTSREAPTGREGQLI